MNLYEWLDLWVDAYKKESVEQSTYNCYKYSIRHIKTVLEDKDIENYIEIELQIALNILNDLGYSKSTIRKVQVVLNQIFNKAKSNSLIDNNVADCLTIPKNAKTKEIHPLTFEQQKIIENAAIDDFNGHLIIFLLDTGLRKNELINLKWENWNKSRCFIRIEASKTKAGKRTVPLNTRANNIIASQPKINEYIFNSRFKRQITDSVLKKTYLRLRKKTGVKILTNHVCRHTFATRLVENKADIIAVSKMLGHSNTYFTSDTYVSVDLEFLRENLELGEKKE